MHYSVLNSGGQSWESEVHQEARGRSTRLELQLFQGASTVTVHLRLVVIALVCK